MITVMLMLIKVLNVIKCDLECDVEIRFDPSLGKYKKTLS